jgi:hypothetical protein
VVVELELCVPAAGAAAAGQAAGAGHRFGAAHVPAVRPGAAWWPPWWSSWHRACRRPVSLSSARQLVQDIALVLPTCRRCG